MKTARFATLPLPVRAFPFLATRLAAFALSLTVLTGLMPVRAAETPARAPVGFFDTPYPQSGGTARSLADYRGRTVVVNFWASWCGPCVREMPALSALARQYAARGVRVVGIGVDSDANIAAFLKKVPVDYPVHVAGAGGAALAREMGDAVGGLPYTVLIDPAGRIRWTKLGGVDVSALRAVLDDLHPAPRQEASGRR